MFFKKKYKYKKIFRKTSKFNRDLILNQECADTIEIITPLDVSACCSSLVSIVDSHVPDEIPFVRIAEILANEA